MKSQYKKLNLYNEKNEIRIQPSTYTYKNEYKAKFIKDLNIKPETLEPLKENVRFCLDTRKNSKKGSQITKQVGLHQSNRLPYSNGAVGDIKGEL